MMKTSDVRTFGVVLLAVAVLCLCIVLGVHNRNAQMEPPWGNEAQPKQPAEAGPSIEIDAVIHPYRSANVCAQVQGVLKSINFEEGDFVQKGDVVAEIDPTRYEIQVGIAEARLHAIEKQGPTANPAAQEAQLIQARKELELARLDLEACKITSPFSGFLAVRYKQPFEAVRQLEKVVAVIDVSKVHAVANVETRTLKRFPKGKQVEFRHDSGPPTKGIIDRTGALIDPKSGTTKVYALIDNAEGKLLVGDTGSLALIK